MIETYPKTEKQLINSIKELIKRYEIAKARKKESSSSYITNLINQGFRIGDYVVIDGDCKDLNNHKLKIKRFGSARIKIIDEDDDFKTWTLKGWKLKRWEEIK